MEVDWEAFVNEPVSAEEESELCMAFCRAAYESDAEEQRMKEDTELEDE